MGRENHLDIKRKDFNDSIHDNISDDEKISNSPKENKRKKDGTEIRSDVKNISGDLVEKLKRAISSEHEESVEEEEETNKKQRQTGPLNEIKPFEGVFGFSDDDSDSDEE